MKVALYARVSTDDKGQDPETQLIQLREYAKNKGYEVYHEYVDVGVSGSDPNRPQFNFMNVDAKRGRFKTILVTRNDRVMRDVIEFMAVLRRWKQWEIKYVPILEDLDSGDQDMDDFMRTIYAGIAELEVKRIRKKVIEGMDRARKQGKRIGRAPRYTPEGLARATEMLRNGNRYWSEIERETRVSPRQQKRILERLKQGD